MVEISGLIASVSALKEIGGLLIAERDRQKAHAVERQFSEALANVQAQLLSVLGVATQQADALRRASEHIRQLEANQRERERYQLVQLCIGRQAMAYRLRPSAELVERADEPVHFVCQSCLDVGKQKVMLIQREVLGTWVWVCPICKAEIDGDPLRKV